MRRSVLIIEDDKFKAEDLLGLFHRQYEVTVVTSVREAVVQVINRDFDLVILDMALPTFGTSASSPGGTAQPQGGVEVLREMQAAKRTGAVVVVSQYPDVEIEGRFVVLAECPSQLSRRYEVSVVSAVLYHFQDDEWRTQLEEVIANL